jgi:hypothetical protein
LRFSELNGTLFALLSELKPFVQLVLKILITHLFQDIGVASLINFEGFGAMGAYDFMHGC